MNQPMPAPNSARPLRQGLLPRRTRIIACLLLAVMAGCLPRHAPKAYYAPTDPALPAKLGIGPGVWSELQGAARMMKGYVIKDVGAVSEDEIWIRYKLPSDLSGTKGGPIYYYSRTSGKDGRSGWSWSEDDIGHW